MFRLIGFLFSRCWHKWKVIGTNVVDYEYVSGSGTAPRYTLQCERCGNIKAKLAK